MVTYPYKRFYIGQTSISGGQIADAPLIDGSANYLIAFVNTSSSNLLYGYGEQYFPTLPGTVGVGTGASGYYLYSGAFDKFTTSPRITRGIYM